MMGFTQTYQQKKMAAADAVRLVRNGDTVVVPTAVGEPPALLTALSAQRRDFNDVKISQILPVRKFDYFDPETAQHIRPVAYFLSGHSRKSVDEGWGDFIPSYFSEMPQLFDRGLMPSDVVFALASPMDNHGYFSISLTPDYTMAAMRNARAIVLEVNPHVPFAFGNCHIHINDVAAVVEDETPVSAVGLPQIGPVQEAIGRYVAEMIPDGATLQIGYGAIPDAVVMQLTDKKDLGVHTEMVGDGIMTLVEAGVVTNRKKNYLPGKMIATFALGSEKLYRFLDRNPMVEMHPVDFTNDPYLAGQNDNLIAINGTMQVDFMGQCGSESQGWRAYSGTGGQADFVRAANRSRGGKSIIVMPSTAKDDTISRIMPTLPDGTFVTTSKNDVDYVVTEYGVAQLRGKTASQRVQELIAIAHPKFRDMLREEAAKMKRL